jgi:hypothetical protein
VGRKDPSGKFDGTAAWGLFLYPGGGKNNRTILEVNQMTAIEIKGLYKEFWRQQKAAGLLGSLRSLYDRQGESIQAVQPLDLSVQAVRRWPSSAPTGPASQQPSKC